MKLLMCPNEHFYYETKGDEGCPYCRMIKENRYDDENGFRKSVKRDSDMDDITGPLPWEEDLDDEPTRPIKEGFGKGENIDDDEKTISKNQYHGDEDTYSDIDDDEKTFSARKNWR